MRKITRIKRDGTRQGFRTLTTHHSFNFTNVRRISQGYNIEILFEQSEYNTLFEEFSGTITITALTEPIYENGGTRNEKQTLSIMLTLCMVMCAISPVMSYAVPGVSASGSSAYGALLTPDTTPPVGWAEDESNPYGTKKGQPFAITPWYEPIIYSYRNAENEAAKDHTKVYDKLTLGKNIIESPSGTYSVSSVDNVAFAVGLAYDPLGTGRNDHAIFVGLCNMDNNKNTARVCYWVQNLVNNKRSELQEIADAPKWACKTDYGELEYQEFRHYFNVTA
ncbi:MAG: hypothetical protein ACLU40_05410, partial [Acutalibacteraceae bacterium]